MGMTPWASRPGRFLKGVNSTHPLQKAGALLPPRWADHLATRPRSLTPMHPLNIYIGRRAIRGRAGKHVPGNLGNGHRHRKNEMNDVTKAKVGFSHESQAALSVEWYTPPHIFESLGLTFDIDVCAPVNGLPWIPAHRSFSKEDDGLAQPWTGLVWCNPPYGKETPMWLKRMHEHRNGVALVFARTDCKWFHDYCAEADAILFLKGRVRFVDGLNISKGSGAGSGSMLVAWGNTAVDALFGMHLIGEGRFVNLGVTA